jgi:hypothetical protein
MKQTHAMAVCLTLWTTLACNAAQPKSLQFYKEVDREESAEEEILAAKLDSDLYAGTQNEFSDLRVVDSSGNEIPYQLEKEVETRTKILHSPCPSQVESLVENEDNSIEIIVSRTEKAPAADGLALYSPLKDYERRVSIYGSNMGSSSNGVSNKDDSWQMLVDGDVLFDYSRYMEVSNREVALPKNNYQRFRIVIEAVTDQKSSTLVELTRQFRGDEEAGRTERTTVRQRALRIDRIELWQNVTHHWDNKETKTDYPILEFVPKENSDTKQTMITVHTQREPLTALTLETANSNFSRTVVVQVPVTRGIVKEWVDIGRSAISVVRFQGFEQEKLTIHFAEQRQAEYRIVISNEDSPALEITGVAAEGNIYRAIFFADPEETYRLYYNNKLAKKPSYDMAALAIAMGEGYQAVARSLGPQVKNPDFGKNPGFQFSRILDNRLFLAGVISLMVVFLTFLLFRAGKHIENLPGE